MLSRLQSLFASFEKHQVKYLVIEASPENTARLLEALLEAGLGTAALTTAEDLLAHEITIFRDRVRIDVMTSVPGLTFDEGWSGRETMSYRGQDFFVVSRQHLIASKKAAARVVDLEDVRLLELLDEPSDESS